MPVAGRRPVGGKEVADLPSMTTNRTAAGAADRTQGRIERGWRRAGARLALLGAAIVVWLGLASPAQAAPDAAALYHNYCSVCHGDKGDGKSRATGSLSTLPRDFTSADSKRELSRERIVAAIAHGRPGTAMTSWRTQLSDADIASVADYVFNRFVQGAAVADTTAISGTRAHGGREADAASTPVQVDMTAGLPNGLKGDLKRGGAFYLANCATCHGARGDGAGPRAYFINPKPRNFIEATSRARLNRLALYVAVSEGKLGTEMPAWSKVATKQQMADVAEYVFQSFIQGRAVAAAPAR
jgi:mono/diheme cytochrome c family protein